MDIENMSKDELLALLEQITAQLEKLENPSEDNPPAEELPQDVEELSRMVDKINARMSALQDAADKRQAQIDKLKAGLGIKNQRKAAPLAPSREPVEVRSNPEYAKAYLRFLKTGDDKQCRALLSTNGTNSTLGLTGYVPVPTFLENEIKVAWEECKLLSLVKHSFFKGNVKIGFELTATGANVHLEGDDAPDEEVVTLGTVEIKANNIKKWITVSDEALEGTTVDTMGYLFAEIAQRIIEKAEELLLALIEAAPTSSTSTAVSVRERTVTALDAGIIVESAALLSGRAKNLNVAMNRRTYAALRKLELTSNYAADIFDGLKDKVVFTDKLPSFAEASANDVFIVIGDFGYGAQANFPNGNDMMIKTDDVTLAEKDLVKIVGRQYVGLALVAENAFVRIVKGNPS